MSNKIFIIIAREYLTRVKKKTFILLTILMPFLMAALVTVPILLGTIKDDVQKNIYIVDQTHLYDNEFIDNEQYHYVVVEDMKPEYKSKDTNVDAIIIITGNLAINPEAATIYSHEEIQLDMRKSIEEILSRKIRQDKLTSYNIPQLDTIIEDVQKDFTIQTRKWTEDGGDTEGSFDIAMALGFFFTFLIYMFVMSYGGMVMQGVMEEKTNRIVEVIVSSVKPFELMMGKIIGVLLVGLTQILIWVVLLSGLVVISSLFVGQDVAVGTATTALPGGSQIAANISQLFGSIPVFEILIMFLLNFLGGYLLYASIFAACGAAVNSQEDSSQFMMPMLILMIFGMYAAMGSIENTNGPLAFWTSMIPFTSPIVMMVRVPFDIPLWQELLSLIILFSTAIFFTYVSAKIYRIGILMHGSKPSFKDMVKWISYK